ncbi:MAG: TonB-dependent receptor [Desulfobacca sp.]|nr:TonB-dependent receptor [Desulfobacca sp.]
MNKKLLSLLILWIFFVVPALADSQETGKTEEKKGYTLEEVVVTASKVPQPQETLTQKVDVITQKEMEQVTYGNRNITEMFSYQPGTFVDVLSRNDANWGSYGGVGPKYSTYLLDGLPIDNMVDPMSLDIWAMEKAEVQRGPAAVMYSNYLSMDFAGNQSPLAGTTNLILKDIIDQPLTKMAFGYGSYNTYNGRFYNQGRSGNFNYFLGATYEKSDYTNYGTANSWLNMLKNPEYQKTKVYFKTTYLFDREDHKISLFGNHTQHTGDAGRPNRDYNNNYDTLNAAYSNQINQILNAQLKVGYRSYDRRWGEDNFPTNLNLREHDGVKQQIVPVDLAFNLNHWGKSQFTFGTDYQKATYETYAETNGIKTRGNDVRASSWGLYAQEKLVWEKFDFRLGGRFNTMQHHYDLISGTSPAETDKSWNKFLWSAGVRYNALKELAFYSNVGTSFQPPSAKSVGGTLMPQDRGVVGKNGQLPNPNLNPESGIGYDLGLDFKIMEGLIFGARGFLNQVNDAIVDNAVSNNPSQSQSVNAGNSTSYGVELELKHRASKYLEWFANYTFTKTEIKNTVDRDQDGSNVPFVPDYVANLGLTTYLPWDLTISSYLRCVGHYYDSSSLSGRQTFGPYQVINMKILKGLYKTKDYGIDLTIDLINLTNNQYRMPWQFQDTGFSAYGSVGIRF